jgi:hypothetical protein
MRGRRRHWPGPGRLHHFFRHIDFTPRAVDQCRGDVF